MTHKNQRERRNEDMQCRRSRGAALIELAIILPFLIVLVLICVDFGRFASVHTALTNAAREGANFGGTHRFTNSTMDLWKQKVKETITNEISSTPGFSAEELTISEPVMIASETRARISVEVSYVFKPAVLWPVLPSELKIVRKAQMPVIY